MTGHSPEEVAVAFGAADRILRAHGYKTINPARVWAARFPWLYRIVGYRLTLLYDLALLIFRADRIAYLPCWTGSRGARLENVAAAEFGVRGVIYIVQTEIYEEVPAIVAKHIKKKQSL